MNKKLSLIGIGVAVGSMLLITSAYAGIGDAPGYNAYKSAVKSTMDIKNVTRNIDVTVEDNGAAILNVKSTMKSAGTEEPGSVNVDLTGTAAPQTIQYFNQGGKRIVKTSGSDVYQIVDTNGIHENLDKQEGHDDAAMTQEMENVVDALVGNLKNYVAMDESNGTKDIHFTLSGSQIPTVVNTIGSVFVKQGATGKVHTPDASETFGVNVSTLRDSLPKLTQEIKIDTVSMNATVDADNHITNQVAELHISGKDAQGTAHEVTVKLNIGLSSFNSTTPDTVDLTGKTVQTVKPFDKGSNKRN
jgi:hypothetical protein